MQKILVMVEGKSDTPFIRDYFKFLISGLELSADKPKHKVLLKEDLFIKIIATGGKNFSDNHKIIMQEHLDSAYEIIIIQDADSPEKDPNVGGKVLREKYFDKIREEIKIDFISFLFPNNESDGNLETLLFQIINQDKFNKSFECYRKYVDCSKAISSFGSKELLENKRIIFNYFRTYYGIDKAKEENRTFEVIDWEFTNKSLDPLKVFVHTTILKKKVGKAMSAK